MITRLACYAAAGAAVLALGACTSSGATSTPPKSPRTSTHPAPTPKPTPTRNSAPTGNLYVAIGDSYAAGFQGTGRGTGHVTHNGYADQVVPLARRKGYHLRLVNFGCSGATTASVLYSPGCVSHYPALGAPRYTNPQADAAVHYLKAHRGRVALVTVSLGGNDITPCSTNTDSVACLTNALQLARRNLHTLLLRVRAAAPHAVIVGTTYPDVFLGMSLSGNRTDQRLATISVFGFRQFVNPVLKAAYAAVHGRFADVTAATGGYLPLTRTTELAPYGRVPLAVAKVCRLTYYCEFGDIHPRTTGYAIIARLVSGYLPRR